MELKEMADTGVIINNQQEADELKGIYQAGSWDIWMPTTTSFPYTRYAGNLVRWASGNYDEWTLITLAQFKERNGIMKYKQGDVLVNDWRCRTIQGNVGGVYLTLDEDGVAGLEGEKELNCYTLKTDEPEMVELTLEDVAKLKGIPVETLRIKD